jgi:hypothetical protein
LIAEETTTENPNTTSEASPLPSADINKSFVEMVDPYVSPETELAIMTA